MDREEFAKTKENKGKPAAERAIREAIRNAEKYIKKRMCPRISTVAPWAGLLGDITDSLAAIVVCRLLLG